MAGDSIERSFQRIRFWKDFVTEKLNTEEADCPEVKQEVGEEQCCIDMSSAWISCGAVAAGEPLTDPLSLEAERAGGHTRVEHTALTPSRDLAAMKLLTDTSALRAHRITRGTGSEARSTLRAEGMKPEESPQEANREMFLTAGSVKQRASDVDFGLVTDSAPPTDVRSSARADARGGGRQSSAGRTTVRTGASVCAPGAPPPSDVSRTCGDAPPGSAEERVARSSPEAALHPRSAPCDDTSAENGQRVEERQYSCAECGKAFRKLVHLNLHSRAHTGERPYGCSFCERAFQTKVTLFYHERTHGGERPSVCPAFESEKCLVGHLRVHRGERPYPCAVCGLAFRTEVNLELHLRSHTAGPPDSWGPSNPSAFACSVCGKSFKTKAKLTYHERTSCVLGVYTPLLELCSNRKSKLANT